MGRLWARARKIEGPRAFGGMNFTGYHRYSGRSPANSTSTPVSQRIAPGIPIRWPVRALNGQAVCQSAALKNLLRTGQENLWDGQRVQVWGRGHDRVANIRIPHPWRDVGPCRVRLASLTDGGQTKNEEPVRQSATGQPTIGICGTPMLANAGIRRTSRDVAPCRVRVASLADGANCF